MTEARPGAAKRRVETIRRIQQQHQQELQQIKPIQSPVRPRVRKACERNFERFCLKYFPSAFPLKFSDDHRKVIAKIQTSVLSGGLFAVAMPRGSGKTTLCEIACIWALLYGHRRFVLFIGSDLGASARSLQTIKTELECNDLLFEDFHDVCGPIRDLERIANRAKGQKNPDGTPTYIHWAADVITLPNVTGVKWARAGCSVVRVAGLTGSIRGLKQSTPLGQSIRPDLVVIDDPQTDEALDIETLIPCAGGFKKLSNIKVGDVVFDEKGQQCNVIDTTDVFIGRECYRVEFDDGVSVVADAGHLWTTSTQLQRTNERRKVADPNPLFSNRPQCRPRPYQTVRTTQEILDTLLTAKDRRVNHSIPFISQLSTRPIFLPIDPYTLGAWLGDGISKSGRICGADPEIFLEIDKAYDRVSTNKDRGNFWLVNYKGLRSLLRKCCLLGNKHIPEDYLFSSIDQRFALLQGLMDTDGSVSSGVKGVKGTRCTFSNTNYQLIAGVAFLCRSLGIKATITEIARTKFMAKPGWKVNFITSLPVFRLTRKLQKLPQTTRKDTSRRYIVAVTPVQSRPVRCIKVDSPSELFLCGKELIATHNSARSLSQCAYRERVLSGAVLGLAGPGKQISGIMPCTVIAPGDLADRMLDSAKHPEWNGERCKLLYSLPERMDLWEEYARVRAESFRQGKAGRCATEYYQAHRAEMDRGALCAWPERKRPDEASALQHAMNLRIDDPAAFASEYQNEPLVEDADGDRKTLTADQICEQLSRIPRGTAPGSARHVTAFIDVQGDLLYWMAAAWAEDFTGSIIDYGTWPDQRRPYFTLRDARPTIPQATGITSLEGSLFAALEQLSRVLLGKEYPLDQGGVTRVSRCLVDANWGMSTDLVYRWCRQTPFAGLVTPSHGKAIGASSLPMDEWARRPGSRYGLGWVMPTPKPGRVPHCVYDSNYWKSFVHGRLAAPAGELGGLTLHGDKSQTHRLIAEHLTSEFPVEVTGRGRTCFEWKWRPNRPDNHWLDCLVGCAVAASLCGVKLQIPGAPPPRRRNWAEEQRAAMAARGRR